MGNCRETRQCIHALLYAELNAKNEMTNIFPAIGASSNQFFLQKEHAVCCF